MHKIETKGGTTFTIDNGKVTITRSDQPEIIIPEADLEEFCSEYFTTLFGDPNLEDEPE
jgi:hypothetical protein